MNETLFKIRQIAAIVLFIIASSLMGMITAKPVMIIAYGLFFTIVVLVVLFLIRRNQRHFEIKTTNNKLVLKIVGYALAALALIIPALIVTTSTFIPLPEVAIGKLIGISVAVTVAFLAMMTGAAFLINKNETNKSMQILGYSMIIVASAIPGLVMSFIDRSTLGIGSVYYVALAVLVLAMNSYSLLTAKD